MNETSCCEVNNRETIKDSVIEQRDMLVKLVEKLEGIASEIGCKNNRPTYEEIGVDCLDGALKNNNGYIHICHELVSDIIGLLGI